MDKIIFCCMNGGSPTSGYSARVRLMANTAISFGYAPTILRFYPAGRHSGKWKENSEYKNFNMLEVPVVPFSRSALLRKFAFIFANLFVHAYAVLTKARLIQAESHEGAQAVLYNRLSRTPVVVDFHGSVVEEAEYELRNSGRPVPEKLWHQEAEDNAFKADAMIFVTTKLKDLIERKHNSQNIESAYIAPVNTDDIFLEEDARIGMREKLGFEKDELVFVYSGGIQKYQCIDEMLNIYVKIKENVNGKKFRFLVVTPSVESFKKKVEKMEGLSANDFVVKSAKTKAEVRDYLSAGDIAFLIRENEILNVVSCPTKFGEYLACGLQVITTPWAGHAPEIIAGGGSGFVYDFTPSSLNLLFEYVAEMELDRDNTKNLARSKTSWALSAEQLKKCYASLGLAIGV